MTMTRDEQAKERGNTDVEYATMKIPAMSTRIQVPKITGIDTSQHSHLDRRDGNKRKAFHIDLTISKVKQVQELFEIAK